MSSFVVLHVLLLVQYVYFPPNLPPVCVCLYPSHSTRPKVFHVTLSMINFQNLIDCLLSQPSFTVSGAFYAYLRAIAFFFCPVFYR